MINRVVLVGRLTKDPVLRRTQSGAAVVSFTVACDRRAAQGQERQTDFINCIAWNRTAEVVSQYTHKGSLVGIEGRIQTRNYDDQNGRRVYVTEVASDSVQFLEPKTTQQQGYEGQQYQQQYQQRQQPQQQQSQPRQNYQQQSFTPSPYSTAFAPQDIIDQDDLPF